MVNLVYTYIFQNKERWNSLQACKKIFVSLCVAILLFNIVSPVLETMAASKEPYDHNELLQYPGYGEAMYQTVVEETAYITGQYTENKDFVSKTIDEIKDYAQFWGNEFNEFVKADSLRDAIERGGGLLLTVGDWFKKLFNDYGDEYYPPEEDSSFGNGMMVVDPLCTGSASVYCHGFAPKKGYKVVITGPKVTTSYVNSNGYQFYNVSCSYTGSDFANMSCNFSVASSTIATKTYPTNSGSMETLKKMQTGKATGRFTDVLATASLLGVSIHWEKTSEPGVPVKPTPLPTPYDDFRRNVQEKVNNIAIPEPRPYLSCPNGTKIQMSVSGSTFLGVNGKAMIVNKDGTAQVDSAICQLNWDKPTVKYIDDHVVMESPDGKWQDVETGEIIDENAGNTDDTEPTEPEPNNPNPSCELSDEEMEVDSEPCEGVPYFGKKLEYIFGNATGNKHNIDRSIAMERQLNSIGIFDDPFGRKLVLDNLSDAFDNPSSILKTQENGRIVRESLLSGPNGVLKVESVWDREKLITVKLYGGK